MRFSIVAHAIAATLLGAVANPTSAQSVTPGELDELARRGERLLREQQQLREQRELQRMRDAQTPGGETPVDPAAEQEESKAQADEHCVSVAALNIVGARLLPKEDIAAIEAGVVGRCIGMSGVNDLLRRITNEYVARGYITSRAYVPPQDAGKGELTIVVIEGAVERIEVEPQGSASIATAFPGVTGAVFNLRDAEQGVDQLNRLASNQARLDIRPGSTPGSSVLVVLNQPRRRWSAMLATDNTGSQETGEWQSTLLFSADNQFGVNDNLTLTHNRSLDDPSGPASSRASSLNFSMPYGWWTANLSYSDAHYASVVQGVTRDFVTEGDSETASLKLERVAYRDQTRKLTLYGGVTRRDNASFVAGQLIDASSRIVSLAQLDANLSVVQGGALWSFDAGVARGLPWFGADADAAGLPFDAPRSEFTKFTLGASFAQGFEPFGVNTQLTSTLNAQWTDDVLYASEQIAISGLFAVRGYHDVRIFGDRGATWRNELAFPFAVNRAGQHPVSVRPFVGLDAGKLWPHHAVRGGYLTGWVTGLNISMAPATLQLSWSGAGPRSDQLPSDHLFFARLAASF